MKFREHLHVLNNNNTANDNLLSDPLDNLIGEEITKKQIDNSNNQN